MAETVVKEKKKRLSLSLGERSGKGSEPMTKRFLEISGEDLDICKTKVQCKNTDKSQLWALDVF